MKPSPTSLKIRHLGLCDYAEIFAKMRAFTEERKSETPDELWLCEHFSVYTLGQAGKPEHRLMDNDIPLIKTDRGGQITYHGKGQIVIYCLIDLRRKRLGAQAFVHLIEAAIINVLGLNGVLAYALPKAPGVYVGNPNDPQKIAALGLRVRKNGCYHGLSLNVNMDLSPFLAINPCGYKDMKITQTSACGIFKTSAELADELLQELTDKLENHERNQSE